MTVKSTLASVTTWIPSTVTPTPTPTPTPSPSYTGPLDLVPGAVVAFDQFAPSAAWLAGVNNYMVLRRDSDDDEEQFQYGGDGSAPLAAIATWAGEANIRVKTWNDGSGNTKDATAESSVFQPKWITEQVNTQPAPFFWEGFNDESRLLTPSVSFPSHGLTLIAVVNLPADAQPYPLCGMGFRSGDATYMHVEGMNLSDPNFQLLFSAATDSGAKEIGATSNEGAIPVFLGNPHIISISWTNGSRTLKVDGVIIAVTTLDAGGEIGTVSGVLALGANDAISPSTDFLHGVLAALYIWNGVQNVDAVVSLLASKYGITLP